MPFRPFDAYPDIIDRSTEKPHFERPWLREGVIGQAGEINEAISQIDARKTRIGNLVASNGDRIEGAAIVAGAPGTFLMTAGKVYVNGDVRDVAQATLTAVPMTADAVIGVRVVSSLITHENDPDLLGLVPDTESEGEPGAVRETLSVAWGHDADAIAGDLVAVYFLRDGQIVDQAPPPELSGVAAQIARYDYGAHENYIDEGCRVDALGLDSGDQVFMIAEGIANILGFKRYRNTATHFSYPETPQIAEIPVEVHTYTDNAGSCVVPLNHTPINAIQTVLVTKSFTETIIRGNPSNGADLLTKTGVTRITNVVQGGTTYVENTSWVRAGDTISWAAGGPEPAVASSYNVTYEYLAIVTPTAITHTSITVAGGVNGGVVQVEYSFKLPRIDQICMNQLGEIVYLEGISAREQPQPPTTPYSLLALAEVRNDWFGTPTVVNNGIRNYPYWQIDRMWNRLVDLLDLMGLERLARDINAREPTAKHEVFVDPFASDRYRDAGESQTAAVFDGTCQLAIDPTFIDLSRPAATMLDYTQEPIIRQELVTGCMKVNPYQVFLPIPLTIKITPSEDFWSIRSETWLSPQTQVFGTGSQSRIVSDLVVTSEATRAAEFLRTIQIEVEIGGLVEDEPVTVLTFSGIDVNPGGLAGNGQGKATGVFTIPANIATGVHAVYAEASGGRSATGRFEGRGIITDIVRQRVTEIQRWEDPPPQQRRNVDPLAQTFMLTENRHIASIDVKFCAVGDREKPVVCEIVTVENGIPTQDVIAQTEIDMQSVIVNTWSKFAFELPQFIPAGVEHAFVFKTDDADHALSFAKRGGYDAARQEIVGAQPYTVGVMLTSSNARTWTPHQDEDLTMKVNAAVFDPTTKTVDLGTFAVTDMSDVICIANMFLPTDQTRIRFKITPTAEDPQITENGQNWERSSYFTGQCKFEALLVGATKVSPILSRNILAIPGKLRSSGTYVSRKFAMGTAVRQDCRLKTKLPVGSSLTVDFDKADDTWVNGPLAETQILQNGDQDRRYTKTSWTAPTGGRVKITITGTPAARPALSDLRAYSI
jgi:hypothetical protein